MSKTENNKFGGRRMKKRKEDEDWLESAENKKMKFDIESEDTISDDADMIQGEEFFILFLVSMSRIFSLSSLFILCYDILFRLFLSRSEI